MTMTQEPGLRPAATTPPSTVPEAGIARIERQMTGDYRDDLRSRRWDAAPLRNPEVEKTDPRIAVAAIVILCAITLVVLVLGYGSGFWTLPA
jgi:hypothetical protein